MYGYGEDGMEEIMATQGFLEETKARAALFHHQSKSLHEIKQLPFTLGRTGDLVTNDPNRDPDKQLCSRFHATIEEKEEGAFELHSKGAHGTAILRRGVTINIPVGQHGILEDGDGIKLGSLNEVGYRFFIYTFSLPNNLLPKDLPCRDCKDYFQFSAGEQLFYKRKGFNDPIRCGSCRAAKNKKRELESNESRGHYGPKDGDNRQGGSKKRRGGRHIK